MKEHPNLEFAERIWSATAAGDAEALRDLLHDDIIWHVAGKHRLAGEYRGPDGALDYLATVGESVDELRTDLKDVFVNDGGAIVFYHLSARRELKRIEMDYFLMLNIEQGQVVHALTVPVDQEATRQFWE